MLRFKKGDKVRPTADFGWVSRDDVGIVQHKSKWNDIGKEGYTVNFITCTGYDAVPDLFHQNRNSIVDQRVYMEDGHLELVNDE
jgi:hypothetical protein